MRIQGLRQKGIRQLASLIIAAALVTGCLPAEPPAGAGLANNSAPQISGTPQFVAVMSEGYAFTPSSSDGDGDTLSFEIRNKPAWATFDTATGTLAGTPQFGDTGSYDNILISVSDGRESASLPAFSIAVSQDGLGAVTLEWVPPQANTDGSYAGDLAGYVLYWGTEPGTYDRQVRIDSVGLTAYVLDSLRPATYYFSATAFNAAGIESDFSNEVVRSVVIN